MSRGAILLAGVLGSAAFGVHPAWAQPLVGSALYPGTLSNPGAYSFAPAGPPPGNMASLSYGSRNMSSASIEMERALPGIPGARAFVALGGGQGPDLKGIVPIAKGGGAKGGVVSHGGALGIEKSFLDGTTISLQGGWEQDRLRLGRGGYPVP